MTLPITADDWNANYPPGTPVRYHPVIGRPEGVETQTRSKAWTLSSGEPLVMINGKRGGVSLRALEVLPGGDDLAFNVVDGRLVSITLTEKGQARARTFGLTAIRIETDLDLDAPGSPAFNALLHGVTPKDQPDAGDDVAGFLEDLDVALNAAAAGTYVTEEDLP